METKDWLGVYGALLSTSLAFREIWKHRRATRPKLIGYLDGSKRSHDVVLEERTQKGDDTGRGVVVTVHNRGGTATKIQSFCLFIPSRWVPRFLLGVLGGYGCLPSSYEGTEGFGMRLRESEVQVDPGADAELRVVLWIAHANALEAGRLMLRLTHSWSRVRAQQIRVHKVI